MEPSLVLRHGTGPAAVFLACAVSGLLVPVPDDFPVLVAGWQIAEGHAAAAPTSVAALAGVLLRDLLAFSLGVGLRRLGRHQRVSALAASGRWRMAAGLVERFGHRALLLARFAIGLRVPLYVAAGLSGDGYRRFARVEGVGLALTVPPTLWLGWRYGQGSVAWLERHLTERPLLSAGAALATLALLAWTWRLARERVAATR